MAHPENSQIDSACALKKRPALLDLIPGWRPEGGLVLVDRVAAVHHEVGAGDKGGLVRGQEEAGVRAVQRRAQPLDKVVLAAAACRDAERRLGETPTAVAPSHAAPSA